MGTYILNPTVQQNAGHLSPGFQTWAGLEVSSGNDGSTTDYLFRVGSYTSTPNWKSLYCGYLNFDSSSIPDADPIIDAKLRFGTTSKLNQFSYADWQVNIFSHGKIGVGDDNFENRGSTEYSSAVNYNDISGALEFDLNAAGIAAINKTGTTTMCTREAKYDAGTSTPAWNDDKLAYVIGSSTTLTVNTPAELGFKINIGDDWKTPDAMKINIGDVWKEVIGIWINIGDVWKLVF